MPVNTQHADYVRMLPVWRACRDVAGGQRLIHAADELYLPRLNGEAAKDYKARKGRALFFNATWRTIAGLGGMLFRKEPEFKVAASVEPLLRDVTQTGVDLVDLAAKIVEECLTVGRVGGLVDYPSGAPEGLTVAQVEERNLRPKLALYKTEAVINWATAWVNNRCVLSRVVLAESAPTPGKDEFETLFDPRWRVLDLAAPVAPPGVDPSTLPALVYRVRVFRRPDKAKKDVFVQVGEDLFPRLAGAFLDFIPFVFIGVDNVTPDVDEPPLVDLVYANISHYQSVADVEHGAHKTALPQPWVTGMRTEPADSPQGAAKPTFYIGGGEIWLHPDPAGAFGMLEYTGQGLQAIETRLVRKEAHMAVLGARMLEDQKKGVETAEVAGMHRAGEQATLATQGKTASAGIRQLLDWFEQWAGGPGGESVEFKLNTEFLPARLTSLEVTALVAAWQSGALSPQELFDQFQRGGVISEATDLETHDAQIANQPPLISPRAPIPTPTPTPTPAPK